MNILAINTSFNKSYVAVNINELNVYKNMDSSLKQSENILGLIDTALKDANAELSEVQAISCVIGPGSFTGIRIGASLGKGFCSAYKNIKRISICSLDLIAYTYSKKSKGDFWVVLNSLSGNLFVAKYNANGERIIEPKLLDQKCLDEISGIVVGIDEESLNLCNQFVSLSSEDLLEYSCKLANNNCFTNDFVPLYLRKSQAEAEYERKNQNN